MARYTKKEIQCVFESLCKIMGKTPGYKVGNWCLDYAPLYGGYVIEEILEKGGIQHPFSSDRRSGSEMYLSMTMVIRAMQELEYQRIENEKMSANIMENQIENFIQNNK